MKAKVIIENGISTIELTPENSFEKTMIENGSKNNFNKLVNVDYTERFNQGNKDHKILITMSEDLKAKAERH